MRAAGRPQPALLSGGGFLPLQTGRPSPTVGSRLVTVPRPQWPPEDLYVMGQLVLGGNKYPSPRPGTPHHVQPPAHTPPLLVPLLGTECMLEWVGRMWALLMHFIHARKRPLSVTRCLKWAASDTPCLWPSPRSAEMWRHSPSPAFLSPLPPSCSCCGGLGGTPGHCELAQWRVCGFISKAPGVA